MDNALQITPDDLADAISTGVKQAFVEALTHVDIASAIGVAIRSELDRYDFGDVIYRAVCDSFPYASRVLDVIADATFAAVSAAPPD